MILEFANMSSKLTMLHLREHTPVLPYKRLKAASKVFVLIPLGEASKRGDFPALLNRPLSYSESPK